MNEPEKIDPRELSPLALAFVGDSVLELLVPMQVLAYHTADCLGYDLTVHSKHSAGKAMELSFSDDITFSEILNGQ